LSVAVSVPASEMLRRSFEDDFYRSYGNEIVDDVLEWMLAKRIRDEERIRRRFTNQLGSFLLKVAAKDTNMQNVGRADPKVAEMY
jgi:hypothetical protein